MSAELIASTIALPLIDFSGMISKPFVSGITATLLIAIVIACGIYRKRQFCRLLHNWAGAATALCVLIHSGFRFGNGHTRILNILLALITASGLVGIAIRRYVVRVNDFIRRDQQEQAAAATARFEQIMEKAKTRSNQNQTGTLLVPYQQTQALLANPTKILGLTRSRLALLNRSQRWLLAWQFLHGPLTPAFVWALLYHIFWALRY